jgi:uncharacterized protein YndB with AHSA1/START domain
MDDVQVEKRIVLATGQAEAWAVVLDFASWFCDAADVDQIATGRRVEFSWADRRRGAVFEDVDPPRYLAFRWLPFERHEGGETVSRPQARVEITLSPTDEGVEVLVVERRMDDALAGATA